MIKTLTFLKLLILLCWFDYSVCGQIISSIRRLQTTDPNIKSNSHQNESKSLKNALLELEERYKVSFFYKAEFVENKQVNERRQDLRKTTLEEELKSFLKPHSLKFEKIRNDFYVISPIKDLTLPGLQHKRSQHSEFKGNSSHIYDPLMNRLNDFSSNQREFQTTGKVSGDNEEPLPGVSVLLKGTSIGTTTDISGVYSIMIPEGRGTLIFSYIGYLNEEIQVTNRSVLDVRLSSDIKSLSEVVVVGYGSQKKKLVTGAVSDISGDIVKQSPAFNISNTLAGRLPGVIINNRSGEPGNDGATIFIRGISTIGNADPLYVIDGVAGRSGFERLNPNDIESISVLKDASAAIYGARAANGVILIRTKRGKTGKPAINYTANFGVQQPTRFPKLMDSYQWATWLNEVNRRNNISTDVYSQNDLELFKNGQDPIMHANTDWYKATIKPWTPQTQHTLSVNGGSENVKYFISGMYLFQDGNYINSSLNYKQYNLRSNVDINLNKYLKVGLNLDARNEDRAYPGFTGRPNDGNEIWGNILTAFPVKPAYYPNGLPGTGSSHGLNPVIMATGKTGYNKGETRYLNTSTTFDLQLPFIKGLSLSGMAAFDFYNGLRKVLSDQWDSYEYNPSTQLYENQRPNTSPFISMNKISSSSQSNLYQMRLSYEKSFGEHNINAFAATERYKTIYEEINGYKKNLPSNQLDMLVAGQDEGTKLTDVTSVTGRINYFGRISYSFKDKYLADITVRRDGSSNFPPGKRWGTFPGAAVGWRISQEPFIKNNVPFLNELKVKASWGLMGSDRIEAFQYLLKYNLFKYDDINAGGYYFGSNASNAIGLQIPRYPNPNITWETADTRNIGFESSFWQGALGLSFDYFTTTRSNMLTTRNASVPLYIGLDRRLPDENIGKLRNKGFEVALTHQGKKGDITYSINGNVTYTKNKVLYMDEAQNTPEWQKQEGKPFGGMLIYKAIGIFHTADELATYPFFPGTKVGEIKYEDVNKDGKITTDDRIRLNYSNTPKLVFGMNIGAGYKGFTINVLLQGQALAKQLIQPWTGTDSNFPDYVFAGRWTEDNTSSDKVRAFDRKSTNVVQQSTYWLSDVKFVRLKNVSLSYALPKTIYQKMGLSSLSIFVNTSNLFTIDKIKYYDPELSRGYGDYYPQQRIINMGVNVSL